MCITHLYFSALHALLADHLLCYVYEYCVYDLTYMLFYLYNFKVSGYSSIIIIHIGEATKPSADKSG